MALSDEHWKKEQEAYDLLRMAISDEHMKSFEQRFTI
jgi:hypothetical protein